MVSGRPLLPAVAPTPGDLKSALQTSDKRIVPERRVAKHRPTLNERRSSAPEPTSRAAEAPAARPTETRRRARVSEELIRLACLWQAGALSDAEFETAKAKVLASYWSTQSPA